jgi:polysaccharide export outer membrane protein
MTKALHLNLRTRVLLSCAVLVLAQTGLSVAHAEEQPSSAPTSPTANATIRTASSDNANYRLHVSDLLRVALSDDERALREVRIENDGTAKLAYLDQPVKLAGLTVNEAIQAIAKLYTDEKIFAKPQVSLTVLQFAEQKVNILGQVNRPGPVVIPPGQKMTLVSAIAAAGGPTRIADTTTVIVTHKLTTGATQKTVVNFKDMVKTVKSDLVLEDGDNVYVPESIFGGPG